MHSEDLESMFNFKEHSKMSHVFWAVAMFVIGVSVTSLFVQGALVVKDSIMLSFYGDSNGATKKNTDTRQNKSGTITENQSRFLGSDDGESDTSYQSSNTSKTYDKNTIHQYTLAGVDPFPKVTARAYIATDLKTGETIIENNTGLIAPIASVSKLMTALIAKEQMDLQKTVIVSRDAYNTYGYQGSLALGEKIRLYDLMYPLLMESSNDGAEVFADAYDKGHDAFMAEMNKKAQSIGMIDTYYEDPSGLNPKNVSTVEDLAKLGKYIYENHPDIYDITRVRSYSILKHTWNNKNRFLNYDTFLGGKNGYIDESKKTTVSLFNIPMAKGGMRSIIVVLLKSDDREGDAVKILNFLKRNAYFE